MNVNEIINDLLTWIECNLDKNLTIDIISSKSGYSKWHLQRMFHSITGCNLGSYVHKRKLTKAALALRMTDTTILDISIFYNFDSQQSFTRAFKKQFGKSPGIYRREASRHTTSETRLPLHIEK